MPPRVERVVVQCAVCEKPIEKYPDQVAANKTGRFFCSREHQREMGTRVRTKPLNTCELCESKFVSYGDAPGRFCTKTCYDDWQRRRRVKKVCEFCGQNFWLKPSQDAHLTGRWCKRACESNARIKNPLDRIHNGRPAVLDSSGYVRVYEPDHPSSYKGGWAAEHRLIAEQELGRRLRPDEHVHHVNGVKHDNRPENLEVMAHGEHSTLTGLANGQRLREWEEYRRRYGSLE